MALVFTRARAFRGGVLYISAIPDDADVNVSFTYACQFDKGAWSYETYEFSTQRICRYTRDDGGQIALYMSSEGDIATPAIKGDVEKIQSQRSLSEQKKLGRLADLRQIGAELYACGDGSQNYRRHEKEGWQPLDLDLFDDVVSNDWVFEVGPKGSTGREQREYWETHQEQKIEYERRLDLLVSQRGFSAINGFNRDNLFMTDRKGAILSWRHNRFVEIAPATGSALLDICVVDEKAFLCGRDGQLLQLNPNNEIVQLDNGSGTQSFSNMTYFQDTLYIASFSRPRALFKYVGGVVVEVLSGLNPPINDVHTVDSAGGHLWVIGSKDIVRFDGRTWERLEFPQ